MSVVFAGLCPHPPIMVPEVGGKRADEVAESQRAMLEFGRRVKDSGAEMLLFITPHGPVFRDGIAININPGLKGNLGDFGASRVAFELENDLLAASEIRITAEDMGVLAVEMDEEAAKRYGVDIKLDHGVMVPLYFLRKAGIDLPVVLVYMGLLPFGQLYKFGVAVQSAVHSLGRKTAVVASGDMSHRLTHDAPAGYDARGKEFDLEVGRLLKGPDVMGIMNLDRELAERAGECGLRPIIMMLGALEGLSVKAEVLSYQGPFGVGYLVASFIPGGADKNREYLSLMERRRQESVASKHTSEGFLPALARAALGHYLKTGREMDSPAVKAPEEFSGKAGVFVSLKKEGQLRGCIGTVFPATGNIIEETVQNAVSAGVRDPRFYPVRLEEMDDLDISVDVLRPPEPIKGLSELDTERYGVIVKSGRRSGLLLPNLEGIDTPEEQVAIARQKAGIGPDEPVRLERFEVVRYK